MKKIYMLAAAAMMVFAANAETSIEYVDLTADMFHVWTASDATAEQTPDAPWCEYVVGESTGMPYGNGNVDEFQYADLSEYTTLQVTATEGQPRFLLNRDVHEGQAPDHLIAIPNDADQTAAYQVVANYDDGSICYIIDIAQIVADKGYAHLHAIKGANWANVTVTSMVLTLEVELPTSISGVTVSKDAVIYNILGQRVSAPVSGQIYIVNGRKMTF